MMLSPELKDSASYTVTPFGITPASGEIWPNSETEIIVNFCPEVKPASFKIELAEEGE